MDAGRTDAYDDPERARYDTIGQDAMTTSGMSLSMLEPADIARARRFSVAPMMDWTD